MICWRLHEQGKYRGEWSSRHAKKKTGFLEIVLLDMTAKFLRSSVWFRYASKRKYFLFPFSLSNMDIGKKTLQINKNLTKQEWTETEFQDSGNRSEKWMQNSFVLEILYLKTEISAICSTCEKCLTVLPNLYRFSRRSAGPQRG